MSRDQTLSVTPTVIALASITEALGQLARRERDRPNTQEASSDLSIRAYQGATVVIEGYVDVVMVSTRSFSWLIDGWLDLTAPGRWTLTASLRENMSGGQEVLWESEVVTTDENVFREFQALLELLASQRPPLEGES